jgi:hypothetical protein
MPPLYKEGIFWRQVPSAMKIEEDGSKPDPAAPPRPLKRRPGRMGVEIGTESRQGPSKGDGLIGLQEH